MFTDRAGWRFIKKRRLALAKRTGYNSAVPGVVAIVGRPNVGKSALFNCIARRRIAIVHDRPGVTRDRLSAEVDWLGHSFTLVDTGGIGLLKGERGGDDFAREIVTQVEVALEDVDVILLVVSVQEGVLPMDLEVAAMLREAGKPVFVMVNKVDTAAHEPGVDEFAELGFERLFPVSALHARGIDLPLGQAVGLLPECLAKPEEPDDSEPPMNIAIVGRPNVGKSSIINALTRSQRVIVTEISGTTRDAIDVPFEVETNGVRQRYNLIDTAGIRKRRRIRDEVEFFSVNRSDKAIERCDLAVLVMDAAEDITEQDKKICDRITEAGCACVIVVNKWDLFRAGLEKARKQEAKKSATQDGRKLSRKKQEALMYDEFGKWVKANLFFIDYAPVIFTSAIEGFQLDRLLEAIRYVSSQLQKITPTSLLNRTLQSALERNPAPSSKGHRLKLYYATQVHSKPPTFLLFVNRKELMSDNYTRYLIGVLRKAFGFEGCHIRLVAKPRPKSIEPFRRKMTKKSATSKKVTKRELQKIRDETKRKKAAKEKAIRKGAKPAGAKRAKKRPPKKDRPRKSA
ncbi:MAG: ribosome biogenesis GTPase Der [Verrucomicrobiota bacterium]|nr:ribosome biogenesis GTPase Der [Verrucomicrobiota bacterium]MDP7049065.1 ribosome biogenesis GTPase Der [Verrucomicrobiota bacterium]